MKCAPQTNYANESFCSHRFRACTLITMYLDCSENDCMSGMLRQIRMEEHKVSQGYLKCCASPKVCHATIPNVSRPTNAKHIIISPSLNKHTFQLKMTCFLKALYLQGFAQCIRSVLFPCKWR